jgi:phosphopantothenoylcysteine decarboxylase / phosphopantothenate---cysteine ligase
MLHGKKIILGITGSIAAYKSAALCRLLIKSGAAVRVIMTPAAHDFITPLTLGTLSKNPVLTDFAKDKTGSWNNHVDLGLWADAMLIAPASANTIGKMANGLCDNFLTAVYLSARCPVIVAPAMDLDMWKHPSTQANYTKLKAYGNHIVEPADGELASGLSGKGRMAEPEELHNYLVDFFSENTPLAGKRALVTAGPTYEPIDPVRFIGNHSSGKMGFALAESLAIRGAMVELISGPTHLHTDHPRITLTRIQTAEEMHAASVKIFPAMDIAVLSAAVADYKPRVKAEQKIKKKDDGLTLELTKTHDIAATLGQLKKPNQLLIGFALETENESANARKKLESKNFDFIVLNSLNDPGSGFGHDTNKITIMDHTESRDFPLNSKTAIANHIVDVIEEKLHAR